MRMGGMSVSCGSRVWVKGLGLPARSKLSISGVGAGDLRRWSSRQCAVAVLWPGGHVAAGCWRGSGGVWRWTLTSSSNRPARNRSTSIVGSPPTSGATMALLWTSIFWAVFLDFGGGVGQTLHGAAELASDRSRCTGKISRLILRWCQRVSSHTSLVPDHFFSK